MLLQLLHIDKKNNSTYKPSLDGVGLLVECQIRGAVTMTSPVFILTNAEKYYSYNYAYVALWDRYYFISDIELDGNMQYLHCVEDYLASWRDNIWTQTFFCTRASSKYNDELVDTLFPAPSVPTVKTASIPNPYKTYGTGTYIIGIANGGNDSYKIGCNTYYKLSPSGMTNFMNQIMSKLSDSGFSGLGSAMVKVMVDPLQYIKSCYYFPCDIDCPTVSVDSIDFGWWSADTSAEILNLSSNDDTYTLLTASWDYDLSFWNNDRMYLNFPPYSKTTLTIYPYGEIIIPPSLIKKHIEDEAPICVHLYTDVITGMATLVLTDTTSFSLTMIPYFKASFQLGVEIPIGEILQDFLGSVIQGVGAAGSALTGNIAGAAQGVYNGLDSLAPEERSVGMAGGFAQLMLGSRWVMMRTYYTPDIYPDLMGEPLEQNITMESLQNGYAIYDNVDIAGTMLDDEKNALKSLLESGIFLA